MSSSMSDIISPSAGPAVSIAVAAAPSSALAAPQSPVVAPTPRYRTFTFGIGFLCGQASL